MLGHVLLFLATSLPAGLGAADITIEDYPVWRAQLRTTVCDKTHAGTDNDVRVKLNGTNSTWLDYHHDDFERGDSYTYDLKLEGIARFGDITQLRISKTGDNGLCLKKIELKLNDKRVFLKEYADGRWLDGDETVLTIPSSELRGTSWLAYSLPTSGQFVVGNAELESRIEAAVGDALRTSGSEPVRWGDITGEAVQVYWMEKDRAGVDLDLKAIVDNWSDPTVDVEFHLNLSCFLGSPRISVSDLDVNVDTGWFSSTVLWIIDKLQNFGLEIIVVSFAINPALGAITTGATVIANQVAMPSGSMPSGFGVSLPNAPLCPATFEFQRGTYQGGRWRSSLHMEYSATQLAQIAKTLYCVPAPASDPSAPTASLIIDYRKPGGARTRKTVAAGENVTITADRDADIGVTYIAEDNQGVRSATLEYDMWYYSGNTRVSPLLSPIGSTASCPQPAIIANHRFEDDAHAWRYKFTARADNWVGGVGRSATVTVVTE